MIALLSALVGFLSSALPEFLKLFRDGRDRAHEITLLKLQMEYARERAAVDRELGLAEHTRQLEALALQRDAAEIRLELDQLLGRFETTLRRQPFLFGTSPVYADFLLFGTIGNFTYRGWNHLHPQQHGLTAWQERLKAWKF